MIAKRKRQVKIRGPMADRLYLPLKERRWGDIPRELCFWGGAGTGKSFTLMLILVLLLMSNSKLLMIFYRIVVLMAPGRVRPQVMLLTGKHRCVHMMNLQKKLIDIPTPPRNECSPMLLLVFRTWRPYAILMKSFLRWLVMLLVLLLTVHAHVLLA